MAKRRRASSARRPRLDKKGGISSSSNREVLPLWNPDEWATGFLSVYAEKVCGAPLSTLNAEQVETAKAACKDSQLFQATGRAIWALSAVFEIATAKEHPDPQRLLDCFLSFVRVDYWLSFDSNCALGEDAKRRFRGVARGPVELCGIKALSAHEAAVILALRTRQAFVPAVTEFIPLVFPKGKRYSSFTLDRCPDCLALLNRKLLPELWFLESNPIFSLQAAIFDEQNGAVAVGTDASTNRPFEQQEASSGPNDPRAKEGDREASGFPDSRRPVYVRKESLDCLYWAYYYTWECLAELQGLTFEGLIAKRNSEDPDLGKDWFLERLYCARQTLREWLWRAELAYRLVELELTEARGKLVGEAGNKFVRLCGIRDVNEHGAVIALAEKVLQELPYVHDDWEKRYSEEEKDKIYERGMAYLPSLDREELCIQRLLDAEYAKAAEGRRANGPRNALVEIVKEISQVMEAPDIQRFLLDGEGCGLAPGKLIADPGRGARWFSLFVEMSARRHDLRPEVAKCLLDLGRELRNEADAWMDGGLNCRKHQVKLTAAFKKLLSALKLVAESVKADTEADTGKDACPALPDSLDVPKRPCYKRDHLWLKWNDEGLTPAAIRDRWNGMSDEERRTICPNAWRKVESAGGREGDVDLIKKALQTAKRERAERN